MRKLVLLTVTTMTLAGVLASSASAAVEVRNSSGELCGSEASCEFTLESSLDVYAGNMVYPVHNCNAELSVSVSGEGEILMLDGEFENTGGAPCTTLAGYPVDDCQDAGWAGWILGPGDEWNGVEYAGAGDFDAVFDGCLSTALNYSPGTQSVLRFGIDNVVPPAPFEHLAYQEWTFAALSPFESAFPNSTLSIDPQLPAEELQITQVGS